MPHVNQSLGLYSFADTRPAGDGWQTVSVEQFNALRAGGWEPSEYSAQPARWRVSKDTLMSRVAAAGEQYVLALDDVLQSQPRARQILWRDFAWFHSDNASVRALLAAIGLDPEVILAPEDSGA